MASPHEPKTETVRIGLPIPGAGKSPDQKVKETVRIQLPARESQVTPPSFSPQLSAAVMPAPDSPSLGPKKETIRVPVIPNPISSAGQMKSTKSAVAIPGVASQNSLIAALVDTARRFGRDFDYSDLDLPFLKLWKIPLSFLMNPILIAK